MNEVHDPMRAILLFSVAILALFAATIATLANKRRPQRKAANLTMFTVIVLSAVLLTLTIGLMIWFMSTPCPPNSVCDAGAMAAGAVVMLGAIEVVIALFVGAPVAYFTIKYLRSR